MKGTPDLPPPALPDYRNAVGRRWGGDRMRGQLTVSRHTDPLVQELFGHLNAQRTTIAECAERAGINDEAIKGWRTRWQPKLGNFQAALNALGLRLVIVPDDMPLPDAARQMRFEAMKTLRLREPRKRRHVAEGERE